MPPPAPPTLTGDLNDDDEILELRTSLSNALSLVEAQNGTIAQLSAEVDRLRYLNISAMDGVETGSQVADLEYNLEIQKRFYELLKPHLADIPCMVL